MPFYERLGIHCIDGRPRMIDRLSPILFYTPGNCILLHYRIMLCVMFTVYVPFLSTHGRDSVSLTSTSYCIAPRQPGCQGDPGCTNSILKKLWIRCNNELVPSHTHAPSPQFSCSSFFCTTHRSRRRSSRRTDRGRIAWQGADIFTPTESWCIVDVGTTSEGS